MRMSEIDQEAVNVLFTAAEHEEESLQVDGFIRVQSHYRATLHHFIGILVWEREQIAEDL